MRSLVKLYRTDRLKVVLSAATATVAAGAYVLSNGSPNGFFAYIAWIASGVVLTSVSQVITTPHFKTETRRAFVQDPRTLVAAMVLLFLLTMLSTWLALVLTPVSQRADFYLLWLVPGMTLLAGFITVCRCLFMKIGT